MEEPRMNRKYYQTPNITVLTIVAQQFVCGSELSTSVAGSGETPEGGWGAGNSRDYDDWDDD